MGNYVGHMPRPAHARTAATREAERRASAAAVWAAGEAAARHEEARRARDRAVVAAMLAGATSGEVAAATGLTRQGVLAIVARMPSG